MDRLELRKVRRRDLDGVARHRQDHNVLPWMELVLVLDHLRTLPVVLDACSLKRELLHLDRHRTSRLRLNHCNIILGLWEGETKKHDERGRCGERSRTNNSSNNSQ